ncbi:MAG: acylneuraminate cytidylyltransferase family protein [Nitrospira sp.]|nr:acylneuraminate cytidylyltransferase family protein [Nitrospira sp.]
MLMAERIVALLPMKAHSERVKGKNFRLFNGRPLFRWILDSLLDVESVNLVVLNTDARSILAEHGLYDSERVMIRDRRPELCGDFVSMNRILADDVAAVPADIYVMTHTTNPLLSSTTIREALKKFEQERGQYDSLFSVNKFQSRFYRQDGSPINHDPRNLIRTQDLEPWYEENSNLYIFTQESFRQTNARIGLKPLMFETPRIESFDIDTPEDWTICELLAKSLLSVQG